MRRLALGLWFGLSVGMAAKPPEPLVIPLQAGFALGFDCDRLRVTGIWAVNPDGESSAPIGPIFFGTGHKSEVDGVPGVALSPTGFGGPSRSLPKAKGQFEKIESNGSRIVLHYRLNRTEFREWHELRKIEGQSVLLRHLSVDPHAKPIYFLIGDAVWSIHGPRMAACELAGGEKCAVATNNDAFTLSEKDGELVARLAPNSVAQEVTLGLALNANDDDLLPDQL